MILARCVDSVLISEGGIHVGHRDAVERVGAVYWTFLQISLTNFLCWCGSKNMLGHVMLHSTQPPTEQGLLEYACLMIESDLSSVCGHRGK